MMRLFLILEEKKNTKSRERTNQTREKFQNRDQKTIFFASEKFEKVVVKMRRENTNIVDGA